MNRLPVLGLLLAAILAGCGVLDPYSTAPQVVRPGQPTGQRVGICYNTLSSSLPQLQQEAQRECASDTVAEPVDTDWYMQTCPLVLPARATFVCTAKK